MAKAQENSHSADIGENQIRPDILARIQKLRLMDDLFMNIIFTKNIAATELVIRTIIGKEDLFITDVHAQDRMENIGRSIQLDIFAKDTSGTLYNIEIQRNPVGASPRRARYHSALLDTTAINRGLDFDKLPEKYIIFITENDYFKKGLPVYKFRNALTDEKLKMTLDDGQYIYYVNGANTADTPLGRLMQDFHETDPEKMHYEILRERVKYYKYTKEGERLMGNLMDELRAEGRMEGRKEGETRSIKNLVKFLKKSSTKTDIVKLLMGAYGLSETEATKTYMAA